MKKFISLLLVVLLLAWTLAACSNFEADQQQGGQNGTVGEDKGNTSSTTQTTPSLEGWGRIDSKSVQNENGLKNFIFRWPAIVGDDAHTGKVATQNDGTVVIVDNYVPGFSPEVNSVDQVFPAYFEQTAKVFASYYDGEYADGEFTIEETETVAIGEYEFYKYSGKHNYKYAGNSRSKQYVIYLTTTKLNDAYFYFLVSDVTEDQSAGATMEDNAYKMALSIYEQD